MFPLRFGAAAATIEQPRPAAAARSDRAVRRHPPRHRADRLQGDAVAARRSTTALKTLRYCLSAGEHLPEATWHAWQERTGIAIVDGIGATEMMHIFISAAGDDIRPGATGKAVPGYEATVLDAAGEPMAEGDGRLPSRARPAAAISMTRARPIMSRTAGTSPATPIAAMRTAIIWYVARSDDMIVSSGYNIAAPEVENALLAHPAVAECAVIGVPCAERGQKVKAFVVLAAGLRTLRTRSPPSCRTTSRPRSPPTNIRARSSSLKRLPKTATGKLRRSELRKR